MKRKKPQTWNTQKLSVIHMSFLKACNPTQQTQHHLNKKAGWEERKISLSADYTNFPPPPTQKHKIF